MKKFFSTIILLTLFTPFFCAQTKTDALKDFINTPELKPASISVSIKDMTGKTIVAHNAEKSLTPASVLKLVTTATALEVFGETYRYKTTLAKDKNNANRLLVHGYGDPTLGSEFLEKTNQDFLPKWVETINGAFGKQTPIDVLIVDDYFGYDGVSNKWLREDIGNYFASESYGISVFDNTYQLFLNTVKRDAYPTIVKTVPEMTSIVFENTLTLNTTNKDEGYILGSPSSNTRTLVGSIPAGKASFTLKGGIPNPGLYLGETLAKRLRLAGNKVGTVNTVKEQYYKQMFAQNKIKQDEEIFYIHQSPSLKEIIRETNVKSNNHYAEHLIRTIGRDRNMDIYTSALDEGANYVKDYWTSKGLDTDALFMYDGCGLSPTNAVSSAFVTDMLIYMQQKSMYATTFLSSLPQAGKEGTVRYFLGGTRLAGKVYLKSGSMGNVRCYAGYYVDGDKKYAFAILVNNYNSPRNSATKAIEKFLLNVF